MTKDEFSNRILAMQGLLYRIARTQLASQADCEDAVQEALRRAWQHRERIRNEEAFRAWIIRILLNACRDMRRHMHRQYPTDQLPEEACTDEQEHPLLDALYTLPPDLRSLLVLHHVEGWEVTDLARMLHLPQGTVKSRLSRARKLLQTAYQKEVLE